MSQFFEESALKDPTWKRALGLCQELRSVLQGQIWQLVRSSWLGSMTPQELVRTLGFARLNPWCLIRASDLGSGVGFPDAEGVSRAISSLGVQQSAAVLVAGNLCQMVAERKPGLGWKKLFEDVGLSTNIGRLFGGRVLAVSAGGGAVMGLARHMPGLALIASDSKRYRTLLTSEGTLNPTAVLEAVGCEPYQIAAMMIQQLGFGPQIALGVAIAHGKLKPSYIETSEEVRHWEAAYLWCESLIEGRNFPARPEVRTFFSEVTPPAAGARNQLLETLYTEVSRAKAKRAEITWHLPKLTYEDTARSYELP